MHRPVSQREARMSYDVNPILDRLLEAFPAVLDRKVPKPLQIGLGEELLARAGVQPVLADLTRTQIRRALKVYTGSPAYRKALQRGGPRYALAGQPAGTVTPEQQAFLRAPRQQPPTARRVTENRTMDSTAGQQRPETGGTADGRRVG